MTRISLAISARSRSVGEYETCLFRTQTRMENDRLIIIEIKNESIFHEGLKKKLVTADFSLPLSCSVSFGY